MLSSDARTRWRCSRSHGSSPGLPVRSCSSEAKTGSGKTRLAAEFARLVHADGAAVILGSCDDDLAVPYQPWVIVDELFAPIPKQVATGDPAKRFAPSAR